MIYAVTYIVGQPSELTWRGDPDHFHPYREYGPEWTHTNETMVIVHILVSY